jgi:hypothetical protein
MTTQTGLDYDFWSKLDTWSYRDAALLLCGFDPDQVKGSGIRLDGREMPSEFLEASKVYRILKSGAGLGLNSAHPFAVVEHALKKDLPMPEALLQAIRERYRQERKLEGSELDNSQNGDDDEPHPRTKEFLLRLIYVMATRGYGLNLEKPYSDAKEIAGDAERMGLVLDRGAVARCLTEARQLGESGNDR